MWVRDSLDHGAQNTITMISPSSCLISSQNDWAIYYYISGSPSLLTKASLVVGMVKNLSAFYAVLVIDYLIKAILFLGLFESPSVFKFSESGCPLLASTNYRSVIGSNLLPIIFSHLILISIP